jgi:hypothetical protein
MNSDKVEISPRVGLLGELKVELELVRHGWHPVRLDTAQMASNADLLAVNKKRRVSIQVKTTDGEKRHSHSQWLQFGYSTGYLRDNKTVFNSKESPLIADVIVGVYYRLSGTRFVVMPVAFAETLCCKQVDYWSAVPTRTEQGTRSDSFPIWLCFDDDPKAHRTHHRRIRRNLERFENAWDMLKEPIEKLHDSKSWRLSK